MPAAPRKVFVDIDVSKDWFDVPVHSTGGGVARGAE